MDAAARHAKRMCDGRDVNAQAKFVDTTMPNVDGTQVSVVKMEYLLDRDIEFRLYKYLTET